MKKHEIGELVRSTAGHDRDELYVVTGIEGDRLRLCDGRLRKLSGAKLKNVRHVTSTGVMADIAGDLTDEKIKRFIRLFRRDKENNDN